MKKMIDLRSCSIEELEDLSVQMGEKKFRGRQIFNWINKGIDNIDEMANLPKTFKNKLKMVSYVNNMDILKVLESKVDGTRKYLLLLKDGNIIESVLMRYKHGNTICVSTQVGCKMGCGFCASTIDGIIRNLNSGEITGQVLSIQKDIGQRISNVVLMGSGEPLDNYEEVLKFMKLINDPLGLNVSMRNITLSTCGIVPKLLELAEEKLQITLAISLHAPNDELRNKIMPINKKYNIEELLNSCKKYSKKTNRRITFEYSLIKGFNDKEDCAIELARRLKDILCHVNLIPLNEVKEKQFKGSTRERAYEFQKILRKNGIEATIRRELGSDIDAACGQLRKRYMENENK
ncbi:23S rRNA (adenine(2503)-C(2))-methyltransferase RlmN [Paramaledivibacter caminithermalis]|uniref:Probable dual-specificity RNA methyltransferase RlmN n=1 Tax=Paramaledivibacter caminithermalis (strain DSM 15212 / CIP 107654 / DViRD3) TaxID=1121301 RepID=A0A1M6M0J1_PARC5|nr:23S rRNA (adenine(2503)-C(2))-methyltransferase RlmN [Paramaledivibacter caminithermalis]SHJ76823.1 23S rRNA m(2)A-2503 methyltransferase [Paramaledivibacter caminithermalis DSM 15212]